MEDEEYFHFMTADLERLHRVSHHIDPPPPNARRHSLVAAAAANLHPPIWVAQLSGELKEAVHHGVEMVAAKVAEGRRRSLTLMHAAVH